MTVTKDDFEKIWASSSPLTPYSFSDSQYKEGWNFVGATPPSRQMWDAFMQNADEKLKYLYQHEDIPLGHEYFTFNPNVPQGSLPLFGGEYDRATYSDLWNWVQEQTGYLKTEAEWQTLSASNNGNVPYYSDGDGSTTFRVPSLKCWVKGANGTVSEVGSYLEAGLPNITGYVENIGYVQGAVDGLNLYDTGLSGVFSTEGSSTTSRPSATTNMSNQKNRLTFDASRSSSIYGNSTTVQPESIVGMWLVKAYGVIVDTGQIDEQQYIDDRIAALPNTFLPLSGGTMKGAIKGNPFTLTADDGNGNEVSLVGNPNGDLTWNGHTVPTTDSLFTTVSFTVTGSIGANSWGDLLGTFTYPTGYTKIVSVLAIMVSSPSNMKIVGWELYGNNGVRVRVHVVTSMTDANARVDLMLAK